MTKTNFVCQQCGFSQVGWAGKCPNCGVWGSLVETIVSKSKIKDQKSKLDITTPILLSEITSKSTTRTSTKISELDRVLGGGLVPGQVVLIAGEPGVGKSTLLLQVANNLGALYVSGEESANQIAIRAERLGIKNKKIQILEETNVDTVIETAELLTAGLKDGKTVNQLNSLAVVIVDSIQTVTTSDLSGMAGSVGQVRECTYRLIRFAKEKNIPVFIVGHVTKEGSVAGPSVLMHLVDTVLWFEGDKNLTFRVLRARKNRFGPTDEVGVFSMEEKGLTSVENPESAFLSDLKKNVPGSAIASILQGTRPILVEIQTLVVPTKMAFPKRVAQGIPLPRFEILLAVLIRRLGISLYNFDCFVNVAGGMMIKNDPSADLAICLSIASAYYDKALASGLMAVGEVGLLGEIREVPLQEKRIKEAKRLGFKSIVSSNEVRYLSQAIRKYIRTTN